MKHKLLTLALLGGALGHVSVAQAAGFSLVFSDEFHGTALDTDKWATRYVYADGTMDHLNDEQQRFTESGAHVVKDGALSLIATALGGAKYASGMIRSRETFYYGYYEARVLLPAARGVWPAFWLNSDYDADGRLEWPPEIDIFEYVINGSTEHPNMIHSGPVIGDARKRGGEWLYRDPAFDKQWTFFKAPAALNTSWQVVGLLWKPDSVSFFLNGQKLYTRSYRWVYDDGMKAGPAHLLFDLAIGGGWAGLNGVDDAKFPQALKIDYVRVCQYTATGTEQLCGNSPYSPPASACAYDTEQHDLPRTRLVASSLSKSQVAAGSSVTASYELDAVPTRWDHQVRTTLVDQWGNRVAEVAAAPPVATSKWRGTQRVSQTLTVPKSLSPGKYQVLVSVGSYPSYGERRISLSAHSSFGVADGKLRYDVGTLQVTK